MKVEKLTDRPRTLKELAAYYGVDARTFRKWLEYPTLQNIKPSVGYYFSISQVKKICEHLGYNE